VTVNPKPTATEAEWQRTVIEYAQLRKWRVAHFRPARTEQGWRTPVQADGAGFPDLVMVRHGEIIVAELKSERGRVTPAQLDWLEDFRQVRNVWPEPSLEVFVWRPSDWPVVEQVLR
jgi:VRR-NUC domain